ncbi:MAG: hypothetical protein KGD63_08495 [Candidatus Lokiarchaeota archaeon]|nr:hypothetical protein [Candidatus Lokiarchaeota archaeon]
MNRLGLLSAILTSLTLFLPFIPIGIYFWNELTSTAEINSFIKLPVSLINFNDIQYFSWGILNQDSFNLWINNSSIAFIISFIFLSILSLLAIIFSLIGSTKTNLNGKRIMSYNFFALLFIILYTTLGFTIYSEEIFGIEFGLFEIFLYLDYGFYILLLNLILSIIAFIKHPIE